MSVPKLKAFIKKEKKIVDISQILFDLDQIVCPKSSSTRKWKYSFTEIRFLENTYQKDKNGDQLYDGDLIYNNIDSITCRIKHNGYTYVLVDEKGNCQGLSGFSDKDLTKIGNYYLNPKGVKGSFRYDTNIK